MFFVFVFKDFVKVKIKVVFNLIKCQIVCFGGGGLVGVFVYIFICSSIGNELVVFLMIGLMLFFFLFGIYEKDGQLLEVVLWYMICVKFFCVGMCLYQIDNLYVVFLWQIEEVLMIENKIVGKVG